MGDEPTLIGALAVAVTALAGVIAVVARSVWTRLFDPDKGLVVILVNRHLKFVDESADILKVNTDSQHTIGMAMKEISAAMKRTATAVEKQDETNEKIAITLEEQHKELAAFSGRFPLTSDFSTVQTNDAIHHLARAGRAHLEGRDEDCRKELDEAERAVNNK